MSCIISPFLSVPTIALSVGQGKSDVKSASDDYLLGHIILDLKAPTDILQITVTLSGLSISRLDGTRHSQAHRFFQTTQQIFPQCTEANTKGPKFRTMGPKQHVFPFSLMLSQNHASYDTHFSQCPGRRLQEKYFASEWKEISYPLHHLPPSTGDKSSNAQVVYSLDASVTVGGIFKHDIKKSRQICFNPTAAPFQPLNPLIHRREISFRCSNIDRDSTQITTAYQIALELGGGGQLILGRRVPINVHVTEIGTTGQDIILNDYQVMLIQKTVTRVGTQSEVHHLFRTLRTVSNLNVETSVAENPQKTTVTLSDNLWGAMNLPTDLTPTFETCNISHSYKLEVRLGFKGGPKKVQTRILEIQFPINIMANALAEVQAQTTNLLDLTEQ